MSQMPFESKVSEIILPYDKALKPVYWH